MVSIVRAWHQEPFTHASQAFLAHHSMHSFGVDAHALREQGMRETPTTIASPAFLVDVYD
jgi:hypothetical protein